MFPWMICFILLGICISLIIKIILMRHSLNEINQQFVEHLNVDTNTELYVSSNDRYVKKLAAKINEELKKLRAQQIRYQKGDQEITSAITNISHDLRTPLTAICGYLNLLEQEDKSESVERYLLIITERTEHLKMLTEELFRYSVILNFETDEITNVCVNAILEESIAGMYGAFVEKHITPEIDITEEKCYRKVNEMALHRVFENILSNVLKYSDGDLHITLFSDGLITFSNHAEDLSETQVAKIFNRFYTVDDSRKSTGLGLSIARTLVEQMGGTINASLKDGVVTLMIQL